MSLSGATLPSRTQSCKAASGGHVYCYLTAPLPSQCASIQYACNVHRLYCELTAHTSRCAPSTLGTFRASHNTPGLNGPRLPGVRLAALAMTLSAGCRALHMRHYAHGRLSRFFVFIFLDTDFAFSASFIFPLHTLCLSPHSLILPLRQVTLTMPFSCQRTNPQNLLLNFAPHPSSLLSSHSMRLSIFFALPFIPSFSCTSPFPSLCPLHISLTHPSFIPPSLLSLLSTF